jgi:hypothetical protein
VFVTVKHKNSNSGIKNAKQLTPNCKFGEVAFTSSDTPSPNLPEKHRGKYFWQSLPDY